MANNPRNPDKPIYIGKPKPRPKPGEKVMKPLPVKPGAGNGKKMPLPIKPGQDRQKKLKTLEAQMKKAKAKKK